MRHQLVVIGGGYGGMYLLRTLLDKLPDDVDVVLIDRLPKSPLKTEFYSITAGTASLSNVTIAFPSHPQLRTVFDEVLEIDQAQKRVVMREQDPIAYDTLVVALGCVDRFHAIPGAEEYSLGLQSLKRAQVTGHEILTLDAYRSVVLIGAGLTGIELAAELRETRHDLNVTIIDRNERVLKGFSPKIQEYVENWLLEHDVKIMHSVNTQEVLEDRIVFEEGELPFDRLVWTAGIQANPLVKQLACETDSIGRALVNEWLQLPEDPNVYVIGDCAASEHPPSAQLAEFHGEYAAQTMLDAWAGRAPGLRQYQNRGALGSLGKTAGFGSVKGMELSGKIPRLLKSGVLWNYKKHVEK
ncbi:MAG: NAD(P)/FAD-dependent oxidoreductase [Firmicutes bacterium]|nr:NAD(P)/FAD-dependent oxidoreductase [Bacillota bacterium]